MSEKTKNKIMIILFSFISFGLAIACLLKPDTKISISEKRPLQQFPTFNQETLLSGQFMKEFDDYAVDQFVWREQLRTFHAQAIHHIFKQNDLDGLYFYEESAIKMEYPIKQSSLNHAADIFSRIYDRYLKNTQTNLYLSIIPDKNYFVQDQDHTLTMNYHDFFENIKNQTDYLTYIDITPYLDIDDYYHTDPHWRQEKIVDVAKALSEAMGQPYTSSFSKVSYNQPFRGTYYFQSAFSLSEEPFYYLTNESLQSAQIYDYENEQYISMYDFEKAKRDSYDLFLSGSLSLITMENPNAHSSKELVIFRDSFASAITPLLYEQYAKITLIDIRYLPISQLEKLIEFNNQDVLFLYSTSVLNNSDTLKGF